MFVIVDNESKKFASRNLVFCKLSSLLNPHHICRCPYPAGLFTFTLHFPLSLFYFTFTHHVCTCFFPSPAGISLSVFNFNFHFHFCFPLSFSLSLSTFTFTHHICCCPSPVGLFCEGLTWSPQRLHPPIPDNIDFYVLHDHSRGWVVFEAFVWTFLQA